MFHCFKRPPSSTIWTVHFRRLTSLSRFCHSVLYVSVHFQPFGLSSLTEAFTLAQESSPDRPLWPRSLTNTVHYDPGVWPRPSTLKFTHINEGSKLFKVACSNLTNCNFFSTNLHCILYKQWSVDCTPASCCCSLCIIEFFLYSLGSCWNWIFLKFFEFSKSVNRSFDITWRVRCFD